MPRRCGCLDQDVAARVEARRSGSADSGTSPVSRRVAAPRAGPRKIYCSRVGSSSARRAGATSKPDRPLGGHANVYLCATDRRKPGSARTRRAADRGETDDAVLGLVEGEVSGTRFIAELIALVDTTPDPTAGLRAERQRLTQEIENLVTSVAKGMPAQAIARPSAPINRRSRDRRPAAGAAAGAAGPGQAPGWR